MAKELAFKALFYLRASKLTHGLAGPSATTTHSHEPNCVFLATGKRVNKNRLERYRPQGHWATSGDIFGCHNWLAPRGQKPEMLPNTPDEQDSPLSKELSGPKCQG